MTLKFCKNSWIEIVFELFSPYIYRFFMMSFSILLSCSNLVSKHSFPFNQVLSVAHKNCDYFTFLTSGHQLIIDLEFPLLATIYEAMEKVIVWWCLSICSSCHSNYFHWVTQVTISPIFQSSRISKSDLLMMNWKVIKSMTI